MAVRCKCLARAEGDEADEDEDDAAAAAAAAVAVAVACYISENGGRVSLHSQSEIFHVTRRNKKQVKQETGNRSISAPDVAAAHPASARKAASLSCHTCNLPPLSFIVERGSVAVIHLLLLIAVLLKSCS